MTFSPIVVFSMFVASIALGALLIYLFIQFNYPRDRGKANLPPGGQQILSSEGFDVYRSVSSDSGQRPTYYFDIDDRIIIGMRDASTEQYAGIRCALPHRVLRDLASIVLSDSTDEGEEV
jgi:hypothetical protein